MSNVPRTGACQDRSAGDGSEIVMDVQRMRAGFRSILFVSCRENGLFFSHVLESRMIMRFLYPDDDDG